MMGGFLDKPVTETFSSDCENKLLKCGYSSMQGWRVTQEDAHNCILDYDTNTALFAVYDGHGGHEVAEYTSQHLPDYIKSLESYKKGAYDQALVEAYIGFDALLTTEPVIDKLKEIAGLKHCKLLKEHSESMDEEIECEVDLKTLKKEAKMPLQELIAKYAANEIQKKLAAYHKDMKEESSEVSSTSSSTNQTTTSGESSKLNGNSEAGEVEQNGEPNTNEAGCSSSNDDAVSSSSQLNGESNGGGSGSGSKPVDSSDESGSSAESNSMSPSGERTSKKRAVINMYRSLRDDAYESDSDDNDESFSGIEVAAESSDNEEETTNENGSSEVEDDANAEKNDGDNVEGKEDDEEDDDDDDDEEDDDDDDDDDDDEDEEEEEDGGKLNAEAIKEMRRKEEPGSDSGCTAVVCLVQKDTLYVANAGDSRAVLCRGGKAHDLSIDHKPKSRGERKRIEAAGGEVSWEGRVNDGLNLSRAIGDHVYKQNKKLDATKQMITALPDVRIEKIDPTQDEFMILACDGIWNSMSSQEAVDFVRPLINEGEKLSTICEKMFHKCLAPEMNFILSDGSTDNMTCIIVMFNQEKKENPAAKRQSESPLKEDTSVKRAKIDSTSEE